jgi:hypothetical protein
MSDANTVNWSADDASSGTGDVVNERIMLPADGIEIRATNATELDRVLAAANTSPTARVELRPRVYDPSMPGDAARGLRRANEVSAYLVDGGVEPSRIVTLPLESNRPSGFDENTAPEGLAEHIDVLLHREPVEVSYYWNAWMDPLDSPAAFAAPAYEPVQDLEPGGEYLLSVHLSGLEYKYPGVERFAVKQRLRETLDTAAATPTVDELTFQVVLLTDERTFNTPSQVLGDFEVNVDKIRAFMAAGRPGSASPLTELKTGGEPDFLFGRLPEVRLQTSGARGPTAIGLSFWIEGRPYAEISIPFCVRGRRDDPCPEQAAKTTFGGSGLLDAAGDAAGAEAPDAALHIVELSPTELVGIFHRADVVGTTGLESHFVWSIKESAEDFTTQLAQLQDQFGRIETAPIPIGTDFKNLLFDGNGTDVQQARAAFEAFFAAHRGAVPFGTADPATIFVRMVLQDLPRPWLYPLGLLNVDGQEDGFLGYHLRVETPLPRQSYGQAPSCLSNWVPVLPVSISDPPLQEALVEVNRDARISPSLINPAAMTYRVINGRDPVQPLQNMTELHTWLDQGNPAAASSILSVISHHDEQSLFFAAHDTHINPSSVRRQLPGSVAVLSGCSTGKLGSAGIVRALNERGVDSIISTNTGITGRLAGNFVDCLSRTVEDGPPGSEIPVGAAFSKAQRCLYNESTTQGGPPQSLRGHLVLSFTLAGNPNIPLCGPGE